MSNFVNKCVSLLKHGVVLKNRYTFFKKKSRKIVKNRQKSSKIMNF